MKRIYTLMSLIACTSIFAVNSYSQNISQNFNSQAEVDQLVSECWMFGNLAFNSSSTMEGAGHLILMNDGNGRAVGASILVTPELSIGSSLDIAFRYSGRNNRTITISLIGTDTVILANINIAANNTIFNYNQTFAVTAGIKKVVIESNGNADISLDQLTISAPYMYMGGCTPETIILPIKLSAFSGNMSNGNVNLDWSVTENETGDYFEIEKSDNGSKFIKAATVPVTNVYGSANYSTTLKADAGNVNYYRLKVTNKDGSTSYSKVLSFRNQNGTNATLKVLQNPIVNGLSFNYQTETNGEYQVSLVSANGLRVLSTPMNLQKGTNLVSLNVNSSLPNGIYILEVARGTERSIVKIIK